MIALLFLPVGLLIAEDTVNVQGAGATSVGVTNSPEQGTHGSGNVGATVTRDQNSVTISGISSAVATVNTNKVSGDASGTLRISWGGNDRSRRGGAPVSPPGAPELPAPYLFGTGLMIFGFGLMVTRRRWW